MSFYPIKTTILKFFRRQWVISSRREEEEDWRERDPKSTVEQTAALSQSNLIDVTSLLSDDELAHVLSYFPGGMETVRMKLISRRFVQIIEKCYFLLKLPIAMEVKFDFQKEGASVSIITFHDTKDQKNVLPKCIQCTSSNLIIFSSFPSAYYYFKRNYETSEFCPGTVLHFSLPKSSRSNGNKPAICVPVKSLAESVGLLLDWLKRNTSIGSLLLYQNDFIFTEEIADQFMAYGKCVTSRQIAPRVELYFFQGLGKQQVDIIKAYDDWMCAIYTPLPNSELMKMTKITNPRLYFWQADPSVTETERFLVLLLKEWYSKSREIVYIQCYYRGSFDYHSVMAKLSTVIHIDSHFEMKREADNTVLFIEFYLQKMYFYTEKYFQETETIDLNRLWFVDQIPRSGEE